MEKMLVVASCIIFIQNIDPALFINMGKTPLVWVPSFQCTWGDKEANNIPTLGGKLSSLLVICWLTYEGDIPIFHSNIKGKLSCACQRLLFVRRICLSHQQSMFSDKTINGLQQKT